MQLAKVIVDVPLMQTDKPYSYTVPKEFSTMLEVGMRVHVPFGKANRLIQGIVVELTEETTPELKEIAEVLDFTPVLNEEQLWLAEELRKSVFSYKISILKAMLPGFLNSSYDKILHAQPSLNKEDRLLIFGNADQQHFSSLDKELQAKVMRLTRQGAIQVEYQAIDQKHIKTEKWYQVNQEILEQLVIPQRAKKKQALRDVLQGQTDMYRLADLKEHFSREVIHYFVEQEAVQIIEKEVSRSEAYFENVATDSALVLNEEQEAAVQAITQQIGQGGKPFLLEGVTGSGKTEVYLQVIQEALSRGKTAIMLVPEISLTPQVTNRFISRFGKKVAILHSGLSNGERYDEWRKVERGEAQVVVGARSAIFAPLKNIGAIIIDEEHEASYKQDSNPRYHARDVALLRAKYNQAVLVLGSATPSLESRARAGKGVYHFLQLTKRANPQAQIPEVEIVDFRDYIGQNEASNFTPVLLEAIQDKIDRKEQVVLMLNRRGYSSFVMCRECGTVDTCPNCDISLTLHMDTKSMNCHYCGFSKGIPHTCPNCSSRSIRYYGTGTQKASDELAEAFPQARILRMDVDTTRKKGSHEQILKEFGEGRADILLGTQMIAKGLDFPNVTLVGVLNADTALNLPDFRSSERTFQLLTQVAGRAGRAEKEGHVIIQSYNPKHYAITFAKNQDYEGFYAYEMSIRKQLAYPPYYFTVGLTLSHKIEAEVVKKSYEVLNMIRSGLSDKVQILGPTPKPIARTHNLYHYQLIIKYRFEEHLQEVLNQILDWTQEKDNKDLRLSIDHEPQSFM
ncbi:primosomal protein N' [Streptococcus anginosus]|uniref:Replication restart protein PriA n=1 Tax=Streptococcus anginosus TaxID=1328 RepID=A0A448AIL4_STRAP|nr:primosomal protein N' [Streptococcus anginosus]EGL46714.1 primosomal protein N' [Streptococcus anginosus SK52 = DSM 20563]MBZ2157924.1 primosomal protein N' [Streptococcus anginosus]ORE83138.1 primosomal protein N' [Streptococcus anginosus SK52 = DSM 20563]UEB01325.1 primosomal protein N' [Streptococcus anginosus subsp. anginosus]VED98186.1 primosomal protein N' [Streptococcus anginosus]